MGCSMNLLICDDELPILQQISKKVQAFMPESQCTATASAMDIPILLQEQQWDVLLLDIDMQGKTGMEIAKEMESIKTKPLLVFVTSHDELVYDSFQFHPFGFVRKSHLGTELPRVLQDCEKEIRNRSRHYHIHTAEGEVKLLLEDICYFESEGNYLNTYTKNQVYRFRDTISAVQNELEDYGFIRIHRGFLVNQEMVELIGSDEVKLVNGMLLPIGRSYAQSAKKQILRYMRS